jgi:hypothetical protein
MDYSLFSAKPERRRREGSWNKNTFQPLEECRLLTRYMQVETQERSLSHGSREKGRFRHRHMVDYYPDYSNCAGLVVGQIKTGDNPTGRRWGNHDRDSGSSWSHRSCGSGKSRRRNGSARLAGGHGAQVTRAGRGADYPIG